MVRIPDCEVSAAPVDGLWTQDEEGQRLAIPPYLCYLNFGWALLSCRTKHEPSQIFIGMCLSFRRRSGWCDRRLNKASNVRVRQLSRGQLHLPGLVLEAVEVVEEVSEL